MKKSIRKPLLIGVAFVLVAALSVGLTLAFLQSATPVYQNTFTFAGGITLTLTDEATTYKIIPGGNSEKETAVTVITDIPCWVYIGVKGINTTYNNKALVEWAIANGWTAIGSPLGGLGQARPPRRRLSPAPADILIPRPRQERP